MRLNLYPRVVEMVSRIAKSASSPTWVQRSNVPESYTGRTKARRLASAFPTL
jgi:hypothetical protein